MKSKFVFGWVLACCLLSTMLMAQPLSYTINGYVTNASNHVLGNFPVQVRLLGASGSSATAYTNANGYYSHVFTSAGTVAQVEVSVLSCPGYPTGNAGIDTIVFTPNQTTMTRNFQVNCSGNCSAGFQYQSMGGGYFQLFGYGYANDSSDQVLTWRWMHNGAILDTVQNPVIRLTTLGPASICLQIETQWGCTATFCDSIVYGGYSCFANFTATSNQPNTLQLVGSAQTAPNDPVVSWSWTLDSVQVGNTQNLTLTNVAAGGHVATLTIATASGCSHTYTGSAIVSGNPNNNCSVQISGNATSSPNVWVFHASSQVSSGDSIRSIRWEVNNSPVFISYTGNPITLQLPNGWNEVCVTVITTNNCVATVCDTFFVQPPTVNCSVSFSYTIQNAATGNTVRFTPNFSGINSSSVVPHYVWSFGNGQTSTTTNPIMTFMPGTYQVCVTASIPGTACQATFCDTLTFNNAPTVCNVTITANAVLDTASGSYTVVATATGSSMPGVGVLYTWRFGSRYIQGGSSVTISNIQAGMYPVCVTAHFANGCVASSCDTITVGNTPPSCAVSFTVVANQTPANTYRLVAHGSNPNAQYIWRINGVTIGNPNIVTSIPAGTTVQICVTAYFSNGCTATSCAPFTAPNTGANQHSISGMVFTQSTIANSGAARVWLIKLGVINGVWTLTAVDSTITDSSGKYTFNNVLSGDYFVKAALLPNNPNYAYYIPTYYGQSLYWVQATNIVVPGANQGRHICMIRGNNPGGSGFIGGSVAQGANKTQNPGDPMANILVILLDVNNIAIDYTYTDANGNFSFSNLNPAQPYRVTTDVENRADENNPLVYPNVPNQTVIITVDTRKVSFSVQTTTGLNDRLSTQFKLYPNPVSDKVILTFSEQISEEVQLTWMSLVGQIVKTEHVTVTGGGPVQVDVTDMQQGVYMLKVSTKTGNNLGIVKVVKQ